MADCECLKGCIFFNDKMESMPVTATMFKRDYCQGDNSGCARYIIFKSLGKAAVPVDLFPNQIERAKQLLTK